MSVTLFGPQARVNRVIGTQDREMLLILLLVLLDILTLDKENIIEKGVYTRIKKRVID